MAEETLETEIVKLATDTIKMQTAEITSLRAQLVSCEGQRRKEVDANTVTRAELAEAREKLAALKAASKESNK